MSAVESTLTSDEAEQIAAMRETLDAIARRLSDAHSSGDGDAFGVGEFCETLDGAEKALFRVLNVAHSYLYCPVSTEALAGANRVKA